jgi:hypothetical protein
MAEGEESASPTPPLRAGEAAVLWMARRGDAEVPVGRLDNAGPRRALGRGKARRWSWAARPGAGVASWRGGDPGSIWDRPGLDLGRGQFVLAMLEAKEVKRRREVPVVLPAAVAWA